MNTITREDWKLICVELICYPSAILHLTHANNVYQIQLLTVEEEEMRQERRRAREQWVKFVRGWYVCPYRGRRFVNLRSIFRLMKDQHRTDEETQLKRVRRMTWSVFEQGQDYWHRRVFAPDQWWLIGHGPLIIRSNPFLQRRLGVVFWFVH